MALVSVSDDKIQITILILRRGALSTLLLLQTCCVLKVSKLINAQAQKFYNKQLLLRSLKCRINKTRGRNFLEKFDQLDLQLSLIDTTMPIFNWKLFPSIVCLFPFNFLLLLLNLDSWELLLAVGLDICSSLSEWNVGSCHILWFLGLKRYFEREDGGAGTEGFEIHWIYQPVPILWLCYESLENIKFKCKIHFNFKYDLMTRRRGVVWTLDTSRKWWHHLWTTPLHFHKS